MANLKFTNFGKAKLAIAPVSTSGLTFTVEAGKGALFPTLGAGEYFYGVFKDASLNVEIVKIIARATDLFTIETRGIDGTSARTWLTDDYFVGSLVNAAVQEFIPTVTTQALGLTTLAADKLPYFDSSTTADETDFTALARLLLADTTTAQMRATIDAASKTVSETIAGDKVLSGNNTQSGTILNSGIATHTQKIIMTGKGIHGDVSDVSVHASTMDIWNVGDTVNVTGASPTVITDVADAPKAGIWRKMFVNAAHTITDNAAIEVQGNADYVCTVGDTLWWYSKTVSTFKVLIDKEDGSAVVASTVTARTRQVFTSGTPTWNRPTGCTWVMVRVQGGGGSGSSSASEYGAGGGGGGYTEKWIDVTAISSVTVTVGAAGALSKFDTHCTGGAGGNASGFAAGNGGVGSGGDINVTGGDGQSSSSNTDVGGTGGSSHLGGGGKSASTGNLYGGGGGGRFSTGTNAGAAGIVIVEEFYT